MPRYSLIRSLGVQKELHISEFAIIKMTNVLGHRVPTTRLQNEYNISRLFELRAVLMTYGCLSNNALFLSYHYFYIKIGNCFSFEFFVKIER
ncbi:hypothetical protein PUN28_008223 [Cardiocondyla obscurior]|uniref:Uncharacterized protein n=1 Tax=Cardiocondyla obscurior TaxID=286306 RepID=A0AAW2FYU2_9HYME